jgi:phytoene dehydrogenase-like protein
MPAPLPKPVAKRLYDVAVLGPDVGGAATAALCSRRGLRALLAPLGPVMAARESEGWLLPAAQSILPPLRQLSGAVGVLDEAGLGTDLQRQGGGPGSFQILTDKLRLSLPADVHRRRVELRRELSDVGGGEAEAALESLEGLGRAWDDFLREPPPWPPRGFLERRRVRKMLPPPPQLPEGLIADCLHALAPFFTSLPGEIAPESLAREAAAVLRSPLRVFGGAAQLADLLRQKCAAAGGDVVPDVEAEYLRIEKRGVVFQLGGSEVRAACVVLACSAERIAALLQGGDRAARKIADEAALPVERKVTLAHFVVRPEGLPQALEDAALVLGNAMGPLLLSALPARRARGDSAGEKLLTVARVSDAGFADEKGLLASIRAVLEPIFPFFDRHVVHQSADVNPAQAHPILRIPEEGEAPGLRPISAVDEHVTFACAATYPGFGLEGQILAARAAAGQALALSGRKTVSAT